MSVIAAVVAYIVPAVVPQEPVSRTHNDPCIESVETGEDVPMPTLPALSIRIRSVGLSLATPEVLKTRRPGVTFVLVAASTHAPKSATECENEPLLYAAKIKRPTMSPRGATASPYPTSPGESVVPRARAIVNGASKLLAVLRMRPMPCELPAPLDTCNSGV